jgi:magnesium-transporting ATPase (P-type)
MKGRKKVSESFLENPYGILGLVTAVAICIIVFFINRYIGRKNRLFDERYYLKTNRAKARSWDAMLVIYFIAWFVVIIFDGISFSFFLLTALYVLHNITLIITNIYLAKEN